MPLFQHPKRCHQHEEHHACGAEMPLPRQIVLAVWIDQSNCRRKLGSDLVVVDDEHIGSGSARCFERFMAGRAAIDGDDQRRTIGGELLHGGWVWSVAFEDAIWNIDFWIETEMVEEAVHQRRGCGTVHIVIAEDGDLLALFDRVGNALCGVLAIRQRVGIGHQRANCRIEKSKRVIHADIAACQHAGDQLRYTMDLRHGERTVLPGLIKPRHPSLVRCRSLHPEEGPRNGIDRFNHYHSQPVPPFMLCLTG